MLNLLSQLGLKLMDILFMKSPLFLIIFCLIIWYRALVEITIITRVSMKDRVATQLYLIKQILVYQEKILLNHISQDLNYHKEKE
ncbi:MAG: hypothetical protein CM15mP102_05610 [Flavobacteriales bacterium]|nr:MAG: hypothetical protein CM15mP102_05610 [Flavobacteriales bacterium]